VIGEVLIFSIKIRGRGEERQTIKRGLLHYLMCWVGVKMADRVWGLSAIF